jgi:hypothetical protein
MSEPALSLVSFPSGLNPLDLLHFAHQSQWNFSPILHDKSTEQLAFAVLYTLRLILPQSPDGLVSMAPLEKMLICRRNW